jgi:hypothetical protein
MWSLVWRPSVADDLPLQRGIVGPAQIIDGQNLDHEMVEARLTRLQERQAVMACVDVEEDRAEGASRVVAQVEAEYVAIERQDAIGIRRAQHCVPQAQGSGAENP